MNTGYSSRQVTTCQEVVLTVDSPRAPTACRVPEKAPSPTGVRVNRRQPLRRQDISYTVTF